MNNDLQAKLNDFVRTRVPTQIFPATVESVDLDACTCDVQDLQGVMMYDVRLRASADDETIGMVCYPARGSWVLVGRIGNAESSLVVLATTELQKVTIEVGGSLVTVDGATIELKQDSAVYNIQSSGHAIEQGAESLKSILSDLISQLELLTVTCSAPGSPSSPPINVAALTAVKARLNTLFQ